MGRFSSRKLAQATDDSVAFRCIAAGSHPDHPTLATFRQRFLAEVAGLFVKVLALAKEMKLLKRGNGCLDGTKSDANASRHRARSQGPIEKLAVPLKAAVQERLALAEPAAQSDLPDNVSLPAESKRREDRRVARAAAKAKMTTALLDRLTHHCDISVFDTVSTPL